MPRPISSLKQLPSDQTSKTEPEEVTKVYKNIPNTPFMVDLDTGVVLLKKEILDMLRKSC